MPKLRLALILAFLFMAPAARLHADDAWPEGWRVMHLGTTPTWDVRFVDPLNGWGSNNRGVLRTTDGGQTWSPAQVSRPYIFVTPLIGWRASLGYCPQSWSIDMTTDGGLTWTEQVRTEADGCYMGTVDFLHFADTQHGWAVTDPGGPIKTTDGGKTWTPWTSMPNVYHLKIVSRSVWYWLECDGDAGGLWRIYKTTDGGATMVEGGLLPSWSTPPGFDLMPDVAADTKTIVVAGEGGRIARSTDFGLTWQEIPSPLSGGAGRARFADDKHGWAFAGKTLAHTTDGGLSWELQPTSNTSDITELIAVDANHAFLVARGLYRTVDGGATWVALPYASDGYVTDLAATPGGTLYGAGSTIGTSDGGLSWNEYGMPSTRVDAVGEDNVWALERRDWNLSYLSRSTDGGKTWTTSTVEDGLKAMDFADAQRGWATGYNGVYQSEDGGASWSLASLGVEFPAGWVTYLDVVFADRNRGWVLSMFRPNDGQDELVVLTTTDGGATWISEEPVVVGYTMGVGGRLKMISATEGWVVGYAQHDPVSLPLLMRTRDGGKSWQCGVCGGLDYPDAVNDVDFAGPNGWVVGDDGLVLRTTDGGATWSRFRYPSGVDLLSVKSMGPDTAFAGGAGGLVLRWDAPPARLYLPLLIN